MYIKPPGWSIYTQGFVVAEAQIDNGSALGPKGSLSVEQRSVWVLKRPMGAKDSYRSERRLLSVGQLIVAV